MTNLETTMDRHVLLAALRAKLAELRKKLKDGQGPHAKEMAKHVAHTARVLAQAAEQIATGKLKPEHGTWCKAQHVIQERVGHVPEGTYDLEKEIRGYEAAIWQVEHSRGAKMRVTTDQVQRWLNGELAQRSRR
jgi:hypothetical protein